MCKVQQSVYIPIPVTDGNEDSAVDVISDGNVESQAKGRGGGDCRFLAGILLGAGILSLLLPGLLCSCSFRSGQNDHSYPVVFLRGAATEMTDFHFDFQTTPIQHRKSPSNAQLRYAPLRPISPEASSMESPSKDNYELQPYGSSPSYPSNDRVRIVLKTDKSSDSMNASEKASLDHDGKLNSIASEDADHTAKRVSSEDTSKNTYENDHEIRSPMKGRRSIIAPSKDLLRQF